MRHYPTDSPEALTRVVALALLADGAVDPGELDVFKNSPCCFRMGIDPCRFEQIVDEFCDDLVACGNRKASGRYDLTEDCIRGLLKEVDDPVLRRQALCLMQEIINADGVVVHEETALIALVADCWKLGYRAARSAPVSRPNWQAQYRRSEARY